MYWLTFVHIHKIGALPIGQNSQHVLIWSKNERSP